MEEKTTFDFGQAVQLLKDGKKVSRAGWNGKGMWLARHVDLYTDAQFRVRELDGSEGMLPFVVMKTVDNRIVPWLASQADILATDWGVVQ